MLACALVEVMRLCFECSSYDDNARELQKPAKGRCHCACSDVLQLDKDPSIIEEDNKNINLPALLNQEFAITP
jgi:hypothetical protein